MLKPFEDTYVDYLEKILHDTDVDVNIVRETLVSVGFDEATINDMLGSGLHLCTTSSSSVSSTPSNQESTQCVKGRADEDSTNPSDGEASSFILQRAELRGLPFDAADRQPVNVAVPPPTSTTSSYVCDDPRPSLEMFLAARHGEERCGVGEAPPSPAMAWEDPIMTPERRDRYREHLEALENILGVVWRPVAGGGYDSVPLEIRSFLCRERVQSLLLGQFKGRGMAPSHSRQQSSKLPDGFEHRQKAKEKHECRHKRTATRCGKHSHCIRHPGGIRGDNIGRQAGSRWECEFCAGLGETRIPVSSLSRARQPQKTSAATGNACGVKMWPHAMNTVGCRRICTKALPTTLLYREDRVEKGLAYRDRWSASSYLGRQERMTR